jgi:hypothetical protein
MTTECPTFWWGIRRVHDSVNVFLEFLPVTFSVVLMLIVGFALPILNDEGTENVLDTIADFNRGTIADKFIHGSPLAYFILEGVDKCP